MGTRSTTYVLDEDSHVLVCLYVHYDGYLEGVGKDLAYILTGDKPEIGADFQDVASTPEGTEVGVLANNGMECLAASLVKFMKEKPSGVYLYPMPRIHKLDLYDPQGKTSIVEGLAEHASLNGSDYMYVVYHDKGTRLHNMLCYDLYKGKAGSGVLYDGAVYKFNAYLEEQKRKAEAADKQQPAKPAASLSAFAAPGEFTDIETIFMPEYEEV